MDVPQPAPEPYSTGDRVQVYLGQDDPDARFHGVEVVVVERMQDSLAEVTDRDLDKYTYRVRWADSEEMLPVDFRHSDLVPMTD